MTVDGATILIVAHDARIISHVDRVLHLEDGCLVEPPKAPEAGSLSCVSGLG